VGQSRKKSRRFFREKKQTQNTYNTKKQRFSTNMRQGVKADLSSARVSIARTNSAGHPRESRRGIHRYRHSHFEACFFSRIRIRARPMCGNKKGNERQTEQIYKKRRISHYTEKKLTHTRWLDARPNPHPRSL
jgi:hypothetical protein